MKSSWAQPSLSRDFILLSAAILFTLSIISAWVIYVTYSRNTERITHELEQESGRIEHTLAAQMESANYLLTALGRQIVLNPDRNPVKLAEILKSFDNKGYIYSIFSWINPDHRLVASSNNGVLDQPVDISDRDYIEKSQTDPWKMIIGKPIEGRVSKHWVIPVAMGLTDYTGKFIGTLLISIDINILTENISTMIRHDGISFAIISKSLLPLTQMSDDNDFVKHNFPEEKLKNVDFVTAPNGLLAQGSILWGTGNYTYYRVSETYPYIILLGYDARYSDEPMRNLLWSRLLQILTMAVFFLLFFWIIHTRMIKPVQDMTAVAAMVARGEPYTTLPASGPLEIRDLAAHIQRISDYIQETRRIGDELRNKAFLLKKTKEHTEIDARSKAEFLAYTCQAMRTPLNNIIGCGQVMKDQLYGAIENRKYRQYVADICLAGNQLTSTVQDLLTLAKVQTGALALDPKLVDIAEAVNSALRMVSDKIQAAKCTVTVQLPEPRPRLMADEFRLQQIFTNLLLYLLDHIPPESALLFDVRIINEPKDKPFLSLSISLLGQTPPQPVWPKESTTLTSQASPRAKDVDDDNDIRLELAKMLVALHQGITDIHYSSEGYLTAILLLFDGKRLRFSGDGKSGA